MSVLSTEEQELFDAAKAAVPKFLFAKDGIQAEIFAAAAKAFGLARTQVASWLAQSVISQSTSFWLDQHAIDRATRRRSSETDAVLRDRIRRIDDAVTLPALEAKVDAILDAAGNHPGTLIELRSGCARFPSPAYAITCVAGSLMTEHERFDLSDGTNHLKIEFCIFPDSTLAIGYFPVYYTVGDTAATIAASIAAAVPFYQPAFTAEVDGDRVLISGPTSVPTNTVTATGFSIIRAGQSFVSRGYRIAGNASRPQANEFIVILPYGTTAATANAVSDMLRQFKGGGVRYQVEVRGVP